MTGTSLIINQEDWDKSDNSFKEKKGEQFINFFSSISPNVTSIFLKRIGYYPVYTDDYVERALKSIPPQVNYFSLHHEAYMTEFAQWFLSLPSTIVSLDLSNMDFTHYVDRTLLPRFLAKIPSTIKSLNLSAMGLGARCIYSRSS